MRVHCGFILLVPLLLFVSRAGSQASCADASAALGFFLEMRANCSSNPPPLLPICGQINMEAFYVPGRTNLLMLIEPYLAAQGLSWLLPSIDSLDLMLTAQLNSAGSSGSRAANPGEIASVLTLVTTGWVKLLPNATATVPTSVFWQVWSSEWTKAAMRVQLTDSWAYLRASNYFFIAAQPYPITASAQKALALSYEFLFAHLEMSADRLTYVNVSIPYETDNGVDVLLPGIAVSSKQAGNSPPQLIVATSGGLDWPLPGEVVRSMYAYLDSGYAVLYYEGPGQGRTTTDPETPLRFTPRWDRVLAAVATYARNNLTLLMPWDMACSLIDSSLVQGCIADPATPNMAFAIGYTSFGPIIAPYASVDPSLLASMCPMCALYGSNYFQVNATYAPPEAIFSPDPLMSSLLSPDCSAGQMLVASLMYYAATGMPGRLAPSVFSWLALTLVPPGPSTYSNLSALVDIIDERPDILSGIMMDVFTQLQGFVVSEAQVKGTRTLMAAFGAAEDFTTQSLQFSAFTSALPQSLLAVEQWFDTTTGAASHCEVGAWSVAAPYFGKFFQMVANTTN